MKKRLKKFLVWTLILFFAILLSRLMNDFAVTAIDSNYERDENGIILDTGSFYQEGNNGRAVLVIHGFTSNCLSMKEMSEGFLEKNYTVYCPLLKGHGTSIRDLQNRNWEEWTRDVDKSYQNLTSNHEKVYVAGYSMGGVLTLYLAQKYDVDKIIVINAPIEIFSSLDKLSN
ncbi:alpha/beta fold hydrolase, partial [archaeon]|nr:alpha/beta fold hydrolase [archaeon]